MISSSSARTKYEVVTPNRADATCLMRLSARSPSASGAYVSGSSPPSPELERAPIRFIPRARVRCASGESAPSDIAVEMKRRRSASTGSTSASGTGVPPPPPRIASRSRGLAGARAATREPNAPNACGVLAATAFCIARTRGGDQAWSSPSRR